MPRATLKRWLERFDLRRYQLQLGMLGRRLQDPDLWHLNRRSVAGAFAVGLFMAFLPIPMQMLAAAATALVFRVNLPISVVLVWVSNPLTIPAILFAQYKTGGLLLQIPTREYNFELSYAWLAAEIGHVWKPLLTGALLFSTVAAIGGFVLIQVLWRIRVANILKSRRLRGLRPRTERLRSGERSRRRD